jgi:glutamyl-tRNA synthetase
MLWTNQQHIMRATPERLAQFLQPQLAAIGIVTDDMRKLAAVAKSQQERAKTLKEMAQNSVFFFQDVTTYDEKAAKKNLTAEAAPLLRQVRERMAGVASWTAPQLHEIIQAVATENSAGMGKVAQPIRVAVSGGSVSPPIDATLEILGREATLQRLDRAIAACG